MALGQPQGERLEHAPCLHELAPHLPRPSCAATHFASRLRPRRPQDSCDSQLEPLRYSLRYALRFAYQHTPRATIGGS